MYDQDWTPVVFHKHKEHKDYKVKTAAISQLKPKAERELDDNPESFELKKFEKAFISKVVATRIAKKMTQKDLAMSLQGVTVAKITSFEQGKEVYDPVLKSKLQRFLSS